MTGSIAGVVAVFAVTLSAGQLALRDPGLKADHLGNGPYSRMHMLLEKTIFGIDVLTADMRFDPKTSHRFEAIAAGESYSEKLASEVTAAALEADEAIVSVEFKRNVALNRWIEGAKAGLWLAAKSGLIPKETSWYAAENLPKWLAPIAERGFQTGDRIVYRIHPGRLQTLVLAADGKVLVEHKESGGSPGRTVLSGFLAPGTEFREPLVRSLLNGAER